MKSIVVKIGGENFKDGTVAAVAGDVAALAGRGDRVVMVHGGGPQATELSKRLGIEPAVVGGRRITDAATLEVMKMVVAGQLNVDLSGALLAAGARPVGLHGGSALVVEGVKRPPRVVSGGGPDPIDFGLVGDVVGVNRALLELLCGAGYLPVVACLACDRAGQALNINADIVANQIARELAADHLVLVTGAPGVLRDIGDPGSRLPRLTVADARAAIADGTVSGGMIPKLEESIAVLEGGGVAAIHIVGKVARGDLARELAEPGAVGTALVR
ncbi:MAG TPA: acetylglutamate kinase [Kofleriaceae bacterium]|nr:acetylglutamate kinase [Kofleriaceae bacterium]